MVTILPKLKNRGVLPNKFTLPCTSEVAEVGILRGLQNYVEQNHITYETKWVQKGPIHAQQTLSSPST
jgi:hypothetical protein